MQQTRRRSDAEGLHSITPPRIPGGPMSLATEQRQGIRWLWWSALILGLVIHAVQLGLRAELTGSWFASWAQLCLVFAAAVQLSRWVGKWVGGVALLLMPLILLCPLAFEALHGGGTHWAAASLAMLAFVAFERGRSGPGGAALAGAIAFSSFPAVMLFSLLLQSRWKELGYCLLFLLAGNGLGPWMLGSLEYEQHLALRLRALEPLGAWASPALALLLGTCFASGWRAHRSNRPQRASAWLAVLGLACLLLEGVRPAGIVGLWLASYLLPMVLCSLPAGREQQRRWRGRPVAACPISKEHAQSP